MANTRIYLVIALILLGFATTSAKDKSMATLLLGKTNTIEREAISKQDPNTIYIIITEKTCSKCFQTLCENLSTSSYKNNPVKVIGIVENDLLKMLSKNGQYLDLVPCADEILFHFTEAKLTNVYDMPSPQLIIPDGKEFTYLNYKESLEFADTLPKSN